MKKSKWLIILVAFLLIVIGGGFAFQATQQSQQNDASNRYLQAMTAGKDAVDAHQYAQAQRSFETAASLKTTASAQHYAQQAESFQKALDFADQAKFKAAIKALDQVINQTGGYAVLRAQAKSKQPQFTQIQLRLDHEIKPQEASAEQASINGNYEQALSLYDDLLARSYLKGVYYRRIKTSLQNARKDVKARLAAAKKSEAEMSKKSRQAASQKASAEKSRQAEKSKSSSSASSVSKDTRTQIRKRLQALGYQPGPWSDLDLIQLAQLAAKNGHTTPNQISKEDVESFLKH